MIRSFSMWKPIRILQFPLTGVETSLKVRTKEHKGLAVKCRQPHNFFVRHEIELIKHGVVLGKVLVVVEFLLPTEPHTVHYNQYIIVPRQWQRFSCEAFNPSTPTVAIWVQLQSIPCQTRLSPSFVIFDVQALWRSGLSIRQSVRMPKITNDWSSHPTTWRVPNTQPSQPITWPILTKNKLTTTKIDTKTQTTVQENY